MQAVGEAMLAELRAVAAAKPGGQPVSMALLGGRGAQAQHPSTAGFLHAALGTVPCDVNHRSISLLAIHWLICLYIHCSTGCVGMNQT